jgi:hypothetical protein
VREGVVLVVVMSGVGVGMLASKRNRFASTIGEAYREVLPLRLRRILLVDCPLSSRATALAVARVAMPAKTRKKMQFVSFNELAALVPRSSWPHSLQLPLLPTDQPADSPQAHGIRGAFVPTPVEATSAWAAERNAAFAEWCTAALDAVRGVVQPPSEEPSPKAL